MCTMNNTPGLLAPVGIHIYYTNPFRRFFRIFTKKYCRITKNILEDTSLTLISLISSHGLKYVFFIEQRAPFPTLALPYRAHPDLLSARWSCKSLRDGLHGAGAIGVWVLCSVENQSHRIHFAGIYGNMDPINIPQMLACIPYMDPMGMNENHGENSTEIVEKTWQPRKAGTLKIHVCPHRSMPTAYWSMPSKAMETFIYSPVIKRGNWKSSIHKGFPIKTSIYRLFFIAMFHYRRVQYLC